MELTQVRKNFSEIITDYHFFEDHSDEALQLLLRYQSIITDIEEQRPIIKMVDFGCGDGRFLKSLVAKTSFRDQSQIQLTLVEPDISSRILATNRLSHYFKGKVNWLSHDLKGIDQNYNLILANHVLYYVDDLRATLMKLMASLAYGGRMILTLSRFDHPLTRLVDSLAQFKGQTSPFYSSVQLFHILYQYGFYYETYDVPSVLRFQNTEKNRNQIVNFALGANQDLYHASIVNNFFDIHTFKNEVIIPLRDQVIVIDA